MIKYRLRDLYCGRLFFNTILAFIINATYAIRNGEYSATLYVVLFILINQINPIYTKPSYKTGRKS